MKEKHEVADQKVDSSNPEQLTIPQSLSIDFSRWEIQAQVDQEEQADWPIKDFFLSLQIPWVRITFNDVIKVTEWITRVIAHYDDNTSTSIFTTPEGVFMPVNNGEGKGVFQRLWGMDPQGMENIARQLKQRRAEKKASKQQAPEMSQPIERWDANIQEERDKFYQEYTKNMHQQAMNWMPTSKGIHIPNEHPENEDQIDMETVNQQFQEVFGQKGIYYKHPEWYDVHIKKDQTNDYGVDPSYSITIEKTFPGWKITHKTLTYQNGDYYLRYDDGEGTSRGWQLKLPKHISNELNKIKARYQEGTQILDEQKRREAAEALQNEIDLINGWNDLGYNNTPDIQNSDIQNA